MDDIVICNNPYPLGCPKEYRTCCVCCNEKCEYRCDTEKCKYKTGESERWERVNEQKL